MKITTKTVYLVGDKQFDNLEDAEKHRFVLEIADYLGTHGDIYWSHDGPTAEQVVETLLLKYDITPK